MRSVSPLLVLATRGTPEMLTALDLPAILELETHGERRYVALIGMDDAGRAHLGMAGDELELDREQLQRVWTGRLFYLWTNFESLPAMNPGM